MFCGEILRHTTGQQRQITGAARASLAAPAVLLVLAWQKALRVVLDFLLWAA